MDGRGTSILTQWKKFVGHTTRFGDYTTTSRWWGAFYIANVSVLYVYPLYTRVLEDSLGLQKRQVVIAGVCSIVGIGGIQLPLGLFYKWKPIKQFRDELVAVGSTICMLIYAAIFIIILGEQNSPESNYLWICFAMLFIGIGTGSTFGHACWVSGYNYHKFKNRKAVVMAALSASSGFGALFYVLVYYAFSVSNESRELRNYFILQLVIFLTAFSRILYLRRDPQKEREEALLNLLEFEGEKIHFDDLWGEHKDLLEVHGAEAREYFKKMIKSHKCQKSKRYIFDFSADMFVSLRPPPPAGNDSLSRPLIDSSDNGGTQNESGLCASMCSNIQQRATVWTKHPVVWFSWCCAFIGIGVGSTFNSTIGNFALAVYPDDSSQSEAYANTLSLVFLGLNVISRGGCTVIFHIFKKQKLERWLFPLFLLIEVFGFLILVVGNPSRDTIVGSAALIGLGWGGVWTIIPIYGAGYYPDSKDYVSVNLGFAMLAPAIGSISIGKIEDAYYYVNGADFHAQFQDSMVMLLIISCFGLFSALLLSNQDNPEECDDEEEEKEEEEEEEDIFADCWLLSWSRPDESGGVTEMTTQ